MPQEVIGVRIHRIWFKRLSNKFVNYLSVRPTCLIPDLFQSQFISSDSRPIFGTLGVHHWWFPPSIEMIASGILPGFSILNVESQYYLVNNTRWLYYCMAWVCAVKVRLGIITDKNPTFWPNQVRKNSSNGPNRMYGLFSYWVFKTINCIPFFLDRDDLVYQKRQCVVWFSSIIRELCTDQAIRIITLEFEHSTFDSSHYRLIHRLEVNHWSLLPFRYNKR